MECHPIKKKEIETETRGMKVESGFNNCYVCMF